MSYKRGNLPTPDQARSRIYNAALRLFGVDHKVRTHVVWLDSTNAMMVGYVER